MTSLDKYIGHRLRTRRLMMRMSQTELAKVLGVSFQQLQKYENGHNRLRASALQKLAAAMQVPITYFFEGGPIEGVNRNSLELAEFLATPDGLALVTAFKSIESKPLRRAVVELLERVGLSNSARQPQPRA